MVVILRSIGMKQGLTYLLRMVVLSAIIGFVFGKEVAR